MATPLLTAQIEALGYPAKPQPKVILRHLRVALHAGELVALLGPNGVGKSTLMRTLAGLQLPLEGTVQLEGEPLTGYSPIERARRISLVLTDPLQVGHLRVRELVALGRFPHTGYLGRLSATDERKIDEAIAACRIEYLAQERLSEISDGQRQKAMIARALSQDGPIMLLDEPTAHLDLPNKGEIMHLLHTLARDTGKAILVSTHDLHLALQMADRLWLADCVEPLETGFPEDLMLRGRLAQLFDHPQFQLDAQTGQYRLKRESDKTVAIAGPEPARTWLTLALEKWGYGAADTAERTITIAPGDPHPTFTLAGHTLDSIEAVIQFLRQH